MTRRIVGIDPGKKGAIALYVPETDELTIWDVPTFVRTTASGRKLLTVDIVALGRIAVACGRVDLAVQEKVGARPGEAPSYAFDFGYTSGLLVGVFIAATETKRVAPAVWKARLNVPADKGEAIKRATELLPGHAAHWPLKKHDGRAEAALLALYGARHASLG